MRRSLAARVSWTIAWVAIALSVGALVFLALNGFERVDKFSLGAIILGVSFPLVGALIASAQPKNAVGWVFIVVGLFQAIQISTEQYSTYSLLTRPDALPGGDPMAWVAAWAWAPSFVLLVTFAILLFPDGRLPSPRFRFVLVLVPTALLLFVGPIAVSGWGKRGVDLLLAEEAGDVAGFSLLLVGAGVLLAAAALVSSIIAMVGRFRRARGEERQQLKWFTYAAAIEVAVIFIGGLVTFPSRALEVAIVVPIAPLIPIATGIAIFRFRLFDIDVVISKTVVFGALAAFFTAVYVGIVIGIGALLQARENRFLTVVAAVVIALAFNPVRERARRLANRIVYGQRATPYEVLSDFSERVAGTYAVDDLLPRLARILADGTAAANVTVWVRVGGELHSRAGWPSLSSGPPLPLARDEVPPPPGASLMLPVAHHGEVLGALSLTKPPSDPLTPSEEKLARGLASQAGLVLRNVALIEELKASRRRLVEAQDEERRRIERNIHDGAQQQLVALSVQLGLGRTLARDDPDIQKLLERLQAQLQQALEDLRDLARGIYPPLLADQGLVAALRAQASKAALPVELEADSVGRYPQEAEAAVYFCVLEALQNVAKYAKASKATVKIFSDNGSLGFEVSDDGVGFDPDATSYGTGLQGMADRLEALSGQLTVTSRPGRGTTLSGRLPVGAISEGEASQAEPEGVRVR
jgi:signal transduction histidine kinase